MQVDARRNVGRKCRTLAQSLITKLGSRTTHNASKLELTKESPNHFLQTKKASSFHARSKSIAPSRPRVEPWPNAGSRPRLSLPQLWMGGSPASGAAADNQQVPIKQVFQSRERLKIHLDTELERTKLPGQKKRSMKIRLNFDEVDDLDRSLEISRESPTHSQQADLPKDRVLPTEESLPRDLGASRSELVVDADHQLRLDHTSSH